MKYIITENKLNNVALSWMNQNFGLDQLEIVTSEKFPNSVFFRKNGQVVMQQDKKSKYFWFDNDEIWSFFKSFFGMQHQEIREVLRYWLEDTLKLEGYTTSNLKSRIFTLLENTLGKNEKGNVTINGKPLLRFRIIKENNIHLRRRESIMKEKLDSIIQNRFTDEEFQFMPFEHFRLHISDYVGTEIANELNLTGDEKVMFRNQIIQYVRSNFYDYLKDTPLFQ